MHLRKEIRAKQRRETQFAEALVGASKTITGTLASISRTGCVAVA